MANETLTKAKTNVQVTEPSSSRARAMSPFSEMEKFMDSVFGRRWYPTAFGRRWPRFEALEEHLPRVDVIDRDTEVLVRAEVPGVDKKDLEISVSDNTVTIKGSSRHEEKEEHGDYYRCEIAQGAFARTVELPSDVDSGSAKANFKDGILEIVMPKAQKAKRRTVPVE